MPGVRGRLERSGNAGVQDLPLQAFGDHLAIRGALLGTLLDAQGDPLGLPGLWALAFGNGVAGQSAGSLFYTAGPNNEADGIYGRIDPLPADGGGSGSGSVY